MRRMGGDWLWIQAGPGSERAWSCRTCLKGEEGRGVGMVSIVSQTGREGWASDYSKDTALSLGTKTSWFGCSVYLPGSRLPATA